MPIECRLAALMGERRLKQTQVARGTGIATSTINFLYWDKVKKVDYATLEKLCEFLDCQPGDLLIYKKGK